jgi:3-dehydroquinate dehydratase/shikimate dehydrogenase
MFAAARDYDLVELEMSDLTDDLLAAIPPPQRVLAWHGPAATHDELAAKLAELSSFDARLYRIVPRAVAPGDELAPLTLLHAAKRHDVVAYAAGPAALWTRIAALQLGAPAIFGSVIDEVERDGVPSVAQLIADYGLPQVDEAAELFAIAGNPVYRSLSPRLHNAAFRFLHRASLYVPFHVVDFGAFWQSIVASRALDALGLPIRAICVVSPYKETALASAKSQSYFVQQAASTNFMVRNGGDGWTADTTDPEGVMLTLRERGVEPARQRVAVVGCGGSGRAIASALSKAGADVTLVNRGRDRGALAVRLLHLPFVPLSEFSSEDFSIVINATQGRHRDRPRLRQRADAARRLGAHGRASDDRRRRRPARASAHAVSTHDRRRDARWSGGDGGRHAAAAPRHRGAIALRNKENV